MSESLDEHPSVGQLCRTFERHHDPLLDLFELEKALYELRYELDNRPDWVGVPLAGIAALAGIITMTPGTLSAELAPDGRHLLVHCFHLDDADATVAQIKQRYESPLREIFP